MKIKIDHPQTITRRQVLDNLCQETVDNHECDDIACENCPIGKLQRMEREHNE